MHARIVLGVGKGVLFRGVLISEVAKNSTWAGNGCPV